MRRRRERKGVEGKRRSNEKGRKGKRSEGEGRRVKGGKEEGDEYRRFWK